MVVNMHRVSCVFFLALGFSLIAFSEPNPFPSRELSIDIKAGSAWLHDFPLFLFVTKKNPPQIAVWIESAEGSYVSTIYVSRKAATRGWLPSPGESVPVGGLQRPEALPIWSHRRGIAPAGSSPSAPSKAAPEVDALSGATPREGFQLSFAPTLSRFTLYVEVNHSLDFDAAYPRDAKPGERGYSGGRWGSGQPSLLYSATIDLYAGPASYRLSLIGRGSPDGADGSVSGDLSGIKSALSIVSSIDARVIRR